MKEKIKLILAIFGGLVIGFGMGYYWGDLQGIEKGKAIGIEQGRQQVLAEQEEEKQELLNKIREAANPFSKVQINPFKKVYKNPFEE